MSASNFTDLIKKYFQALATRYYEQINGSSEAPKYLHETMLTEEYSADMTYTSISGDFTRVTADVVSYDSPLPLKKRASLSKAKGDIPKMGMKYVLDEKQMNMLGILRQQPGRLAELAKKVFQDVFNGIFGIKELIEYAFHVGLSSGVTIIPDATNAGKHGIRIDFGVPAENFSGVVKKWSDSSAKPVDDIKRIRKQARGKGIKHAHIWMDDATATRLLTNDQIRSSYAFSRGFTGSDIPNPTESQLMTLFKNEWKLNLHIMERSFTFELNGTRTVKDGWTPNMVVFTVDTNVGSLVYSTLAEENFPVKDVDYAKPNAYILVSKSGSTDPVSEKTATQAIVIPVLQNVEELFYLDTEEAETDAQTEGDGTFTYKTVDYTLASVVLGINTANENANVTVSNTDAELLDVINALNDAEVELFEAELITV